MVKLVDNAGQHKITVPKDIVESKGWNSDTHLRFIENSDGTLLLKSTDGKGTKIVNNSGQYKITIPKDIVLDKGWASGTKLRFIEDVNENIILKAIQDVR